MAKIKLLTVLVGHATLLGHTKKKPMGAAAISADGFVLAVAAETIITLWDPERNYLVAVIVESSAPINDLSFVGNSECLLSAFHGSMSQLSVWSLSNLSLAWSYKLQVQAVACMDNTATRFFDSSYNISNTNITKAPVKSTLLNEEKDGC